MTPGPASRKCTAYLLAGPGGMPLGLGFNEGLGPMVPGRNAATGCHERMPYPACADCVGALRTRRAV